MCVFFLVALVYLVSPRGNSYCVTEMLSLSLCLGATHMTDRINMKNVTLFYESIQNCWRFAVRI